MEWVLERLGIMFGIGVTFYNQSTLKLIQEIATNDLNNKLVHLPRIVEGIMCIILVIFCVIEDCIAMCLQRIR